MAKMKKYAEGGELPQDLTDRLAREDNKATRELVTKPARAVMERAKKMAGTLTGKGAKDFEPAKRTRATGYTDEDGTPQREIKAPTDAVTSPVGGRGNEVRSLNMGKRAQKEGFDDFKAGGKVSSASKRADGCAIRGKTRA
jgi:hypothetical protein